MFIHAFVYKDGFLCYCIRANDDSCVFENMYDKVI